MEYFTDGLKNWSDFDGKADRQQFWMYILFYVLFYVAALFVDMTLGLGFLTAIYSLVLLVPNLSIGARRLHDTGRSGWWQLIGLIPLLGAIVLIIFFVQGSNPDSEY